jgi:hypothetical protein
LGERSAESEKDFADMTQVVIASRLSDGLVVFLKTAKPDSVEWVLALNEADLADDDDRAAELLSAGEADAKQSQSIIDPYLIDVERQGGTLRPTKYREAIRCLGPTIRLDLGKQAEGPEA